MVSGIQPWDIHIVATAVPFADGAGQAAGAEVCIRKGKEMHRAAAGNAVAETGIH